MKWKVLTPGTHGQGVVSIHIQLGSELSGKQGKKEGVMSFLVSVLTV